MDNRIFWLAVGSFTISTEGFVISTLLPAIASDARISVATAGFLITAFAFSYALGGPVLATLTGTWDRRSVIVSTMVLFVLGNLMAAASSGFAILLLARVLMALAAGLFAATAQATAVSLVDDHHRARAIAVVVGGTTVAVAFGAPLGALIGAAYGWRGTFAVIAMLGALAALVLGWRLPRGLQGSRLPVRERVAAALAPGMPAMLSVTLLCLAGAFTVLSYIAPLAMRSAGLGEDALPVMLLAFGIGAVIGNFAGGQLSDRFGATRTVFAALLANAIVLLCLTLIPAVLPDRPGRAGADRRHGALGHRRLELHARAGQPHRARMRREPRPSSCRSTGRRCISEWRWAPSSAAQSCVSRRPWTSAGSVQCSNWSVSRSCCRRGIRRRRHEG